MAARANSEEDGKKVMGTAFLVIGGLAMACQLGALALTVAPLLHDSFTQSPTLWTDFGLASLHALRSAVFHPAVVAWFVAKMLVLFFALGIIVMGLAFLRKRTVAPATQNLPMGGSRRGDQ